MQACSGHMLAALCNRQDLTFEKGSFWYVMFEKSASTTTHVVFRSNKSHENIQRCTRRILYTTEFIYVN